LLSSRVRFRFANRKSFCANIISPVDSFSSNGQQCLNRLSHLRGPPQFDTDKQYMSTGVSHARADSVTGLPIPNMSIVVPGLTSPHIIDIKYADSEGKQHGPFHVAFDPQHEVVTETKDILDSIPAWVSFREYPAGNMLVYFTTLVSYKNAFREIRYSLNNESVSQRLKFKPDWSSRGSPGIGREDETYLSIPMSTKFVCVKLFYIDGTESPIKEFKVAELGLTQ
jgi:hypothetical protein